MKEKNLKLERKVNLVTAWGKICDWIKKNASGVFADGARFNCEHEIYHWTALVITENGDARIYHGSHGSDRPENVATKTEFYSMSNGRFCNCKTINGNNYSEEEISEVADGSRNDLFRESIFEEVILQWGTLKKDILYRIKQEKMIQNFEP